MWVRRYPPLVAFVIALLIMIVVMPSALNLPQANPTTVLEYAPIPPEKNDNPPPSSGSLSALGLGTSSTISTEAGGLKAPNKISKAGQGENPIVKRCVGDPPRQTEDVNSPPCVPFFEGENGGQTYRGITKDEVRVVFYSDTYMTIGPEGTESTPSPGEVCDIDSKPNDPENVGCTNGEGTKDHDLVIIVRALSRYFNDRFQTYGRHIHLYIYWAASPASPATRRSEVQDMFERIKPFATVDYTNPALGGHTDAFIVAAVKRQLEVFGNYAMSPNSVYRENAPFLWSFWPDIEHQVALFKDYFCKRIAPFPVSHSGNADEMGKPRKYGFFYTTDDNVSQLQKFAKLSKEALLKGCPNGARMNFSSNDYTYSRNGYSADTNPDAPADAQQNVQKMQLDGITTVVWLGGFETQTSAAAKQANWFPEWVVAGDLSNDQVEEQSFQDPDVWRHARIMTNQLLEDKRADTPCRQAFREGNPYGTPGQESSACGIYRAFFMLFRSIQVAGPFLTPDSIDQGNHSIQAVRSTDPYIASCFFDPGDYTCVKDAQEEFWDPDQPNPNGQADAQPGCWRAVERGKRYVVNTFTQEDKAFKISAETPCNATTDNTSNINPYGPAG
jgi:hypothetical protein